jgi:hypothetical protein
VNDHPAMQEVVAKLIRRDLFLLGAPAMFASLAITLWIVAGALLDWSGWMVMGTAGLAFLLTVLALGYWCARRWNDDLRPFRKNGS